MHISIHNWIRVESLEQTMARVAPLGYDAIDLKGEPDLYEAEEILDLCEKYAMRISSGVTIMSGERSLIAIDPAIRKHSIQYVIDCIKLLHKVGGKMLTVVPSNVGNISPEGSPEQEWDLAVDSLKQCYAVAEELGVKLAIEAINRFETHFINRVEQAMALATEVGENCGVCLDTFHMNIEELDLLAVVRQAAPRLLQVHVADSNRMPPGDGSINWNAFIDTLEEVGYTGYFSIEFSPSVDRSPLRVSPRASEPIEEIDEVEYQFLQDHGSTQLSPQWMQQLSANAIHFLRELNRNRQAPQANLNPHEIVDIRAFWLQTPIPPEKQHVSDFGRISSFDCVLVEVEIRNGQVGYGEAKASVGSSGSCGAIVATILTDLKPQLIGMDCRQINRIWETAYNGTRDHYALTHGRAFPILGRRGLAISALSGIDIALWDLKGKLLNTSLVNLLGGSCRETMPAYASGGWAAEDSIGDQLLGYVEQGFKAVKMRVGVIDGSPDASARRLHAARKAVGDDIKIMVDAHGTLSVPEAKRFCQLSEDANPFWFEEPCNSDHYEGSAEVRRSTSIPIAIGESEFTRFDMREVIRHRAADILQPDCAIIGGVTETVRVAHLADTHQLALAPHCWGSAISFRAGSSIAFASPAAIILEFSLGANPMLYELANEKIEIDKQGNLPCPELPGLGVTINPDFVKEYTQKIYL